jgi:hypothetical protein
MPDMYPGDWADLPPFTAPPTNQRGSIAGECTCGCLLSALIPTWAVRGQARAQVAGLPVAGPGGRRHHGALGGRGGERGGDVPPAVEATSKSRCKKAHFSTNLFSTPAAACPLVGAAQPVHDALTAKTESTEHQVIVSDLVRCTRG